MCGQKVRPRARAWIETYQVATDRRRAAFALARGRGLKLPHLGGLRGFGKFALARGRGLKPNDYTHRIASAMFALARGRGLKPVTRVFAVPLKVRPRARAWIETVR